MKTPPTQPHIPPNAWKHRFKEGEPILLKGIGFMVVKINKRGMTLRHVSATSPQPT